MASFRLVAAILAPMTMAVLGSGAIVVDARAADSVGCVARKVVFDGNETLRYASVRAASGPKYLERTSSPDSVNTQAGIARGPKARSRSFLIKSPDGKRALSIETDGTRMVSMHAGAIGEFQTDRDGSFLVVPCETTTY